MATISIHDVSGGSVARSCHRRKEYSFDVIRLVIGDLTCELFTGPDELAWLAPIDLPATETAALLAERYEEEAA